MSSNVLIQIVKPRHLKVKALLQGPNGKGGWSTHTSCEIEGEPLLVQVHAGSRVIIEEIDPGDHRMPVLRLEPRASS